MSGTYVPLMSIVARWFVKGRALASGIVVSGVGIGIIIAPPLANYLISSYSWRISYVILGFIVIVLVVIIAQFQRRAPSQRSHIDYSTNMVKTDSPNVQVYGFSLRESTGTSQFWIISVMSLFFGFEMQTAMVHIAAHATDIGVSAAAAATILSVIGIISIGSKVVLGIVGDRIGNRNVMIIVFILTSLSFLWLIFASELWMLYLFAAIFGLGYGGFVTVQSPLVADFFGLRAHGAIFGLAAFGSSAGGALGSLVSGSIFDISGSYHWAFILSAMLGIASLILSILLKPARK